MPDHDFEPGSYGVCRRCGDEKHGPVGGKGMVTNKQFAIKVVWKDGTEEYLLRGICAHGPVALFPSQERAEEQKSFMLEGMSGGVQSINVVRWGGC